MNNYKTISKLLLDYINSREDKDKIVFATIQGGYARGTANTESDVDVLLAFSCVEDIANNTHFVEYGEKLIEIRFLCLSEISEPKYWLERTRYIYDNETIFLFGDEDKWKNIQSQCQMSNIEKRDLIVFVLKRCARRGIYYKEEALHAQTRSANMTINALGMSRKNYWIERNDYISAKLLCLSTFEYLVILIFALNNKFVPSPKYRYFILQNLRWKPKSLMHYFNVIKCDEGYSYDQIQNMFCDILTECVYKAKNDGIDFDGYESYQYSTDLPILKEDANF